MWPADALKPFAIPWDRWLPGSAAASQDERADRVEFYARTCPTSPFRSENDAARNELFASMLIR